ncbi:hypothetical protein V2G26_018532 [Clonostachys chloroleuca]|uniref:Uncharacterized protein n=1 Tax=Clonostachys chloroleuca TaxID=1926264 RepID=A0AA35M1F7_9HYPO|nr:unnamed protein product [Clonostachys chloroleuca]
MKFIISFFGLVTLVAAAPSQNPTRTQPLEKRATTLCGQWDSVETGGYTIYNNLWGQDNGSGSQCLTVEGVTDGLAAWSSTWSWSGGSSSVKSYSNAVVSADAVRISAISSIPSKWEWSYTGTDIVANVAYDLFSNADCGDTPEYEIMIWLSALGGAGPISSTGSSIATVTLAGASWNLWKGQNNQMTVFSFVAASDQNSFSGDLNDFIQYLVESQGYSGSQCLYSIGAGTEPFTGTNAEFITSGYSVSVSAGDSGSDETTTPSQAQSSSVETSTATQPHSSSTVAPTKTLSQPSNESTTTPVQSQPSSVETTPSAHPQPTSVGTTTSAQAQPTSETGCSRRKKRRVSV